MRDNADYVNLVNRLVQECDRYGLPAGEGDDPTWMFENLLRHIYNNRDATHAIDANTIAELQRRLDDHAR
jgi:hypothetical protein